MTMKDEIYRAFFLAFGFMELWNNSSYLIKKNGMSSARKQHQEIPKDATDMQMQRKVVCMLIVGVAFFVASLQSYLTHSFSLISYGVLMIAFVLYSYAEAIYYRYIRTTIAAILITLVTLLLFL